MINFRLINGDVFISPSSVSKVLGATETSVANIGSEIFSIRIDTNDGVKWLVLTEKTKGTRICAQIIGKTLPAVEEGKVYGGTITL